ncbi:MAG: HU family DNA-binding protein [Desulfovibrio sp.]|nr:HU family DNA-binding protein [Desulfovibrio sp.]
MTKAEFVAALRQALPEIFPTRAAAEKSYAAFCSILAGAILSGDGARLPGVGSFSLTRRAARTGRNPRTGGPVRIPARNAVKFSPSRSLADKVSR